MIKRISSYTEKDAAKQRVQRLRHPERFALRNRRAKLRLAYGLTVKGYETLFVSQNGVCAICHNPETTQHKHRAKPLRLSVDHNHRTRQVRGLLCRQCNAAIGYLQDSSLRALAAAAYLEKHATFERG